MILDTENSLWKSNFVTFWLGIKARHSILGHLQSRRIANFDKLALKLCILGKNSFSMNTYVVQVVLCKYGFNSSGKGAILPLKQTNVVTFDPINSHTHLNIIICSLSSCGSSVSQNCTYIQNPSYPTSYTTTGTCAFSVTPLSSGILIIIYKGFHLISCQSKY